MKKSFFAVVVLPIYLSGCATGIGKNIKDFYAVRFYQDTVASEKARLRIIKSDRDYYKIYPSGCLTYKDTQAGILEAPVVARGSVMDQLKNKVMTHKEKLVGIPYPPEVNNGYYIEYYVPANQKVAFSMSRSVPSGNQIVTCGQSIKTVFEPGKDYELKELAGGGVYSCPYGIEEVQNDGTRRMHLIQQISNKEPGCPPR